MSAIPGEHVKVDRAVCRWLIRKFVNKYPFFVPADKVMTGKTPGCDPK
jgi:hypothetical protein